MTKSTITRERLEWLSQISCRDDIEDIGGDEIRELASMALAAMDSEPVAEVYAELYRLREEVKGPDGFNTWRDAAIAEKKARVELEKQINQSERDIDYLGAMAAFHSNEWHKMDPITGYMHGWNARKSQAIFPVRPTPSRDQVRREHAEWSQATFGNVGPIGPLKHLSKEALEAAAEPGDLSEWADMQFLLWDAQRRAGITDDQITQAMIDKLAVNKQRSWPEPKDGEPRLHIKSQPALTGNFPIIGIDLASGPDRTVEVSYVAPPGYVMVPKEPTDEMIAAAMNCEDVLFNSDDSFCVQFGNIYEAMLAAAPQSPGSEPATVPGKWIPVSEKMPPSRHEVLVGRWWEEKPRWCCKWATYIPGHPDAQSSGWLIPGASWTPTHWMPLPAAPQEVKSES